MAMEKAWGAFKKLTMFAPKRSKYWVPAGAKQPGTPDGSGGAYRYPAPGSRPQAAVPNQDSSDDLLFNTNYYPRDTRRQPSTVYVATNPGSMLSQQLNLPAEAAPLEGSPGNNNPDIAKLGAAGYNYDGLRSAMATTHELHQASLAKYQPTHLPRYAWEKDMSWLEDLNAKGLPPTPGKPAEWKLPFKPENHPAGMW